MQDGALVDRNSVVLNALKDSGILHHSVSKVEVFEGSMEGKHLVITCTLTVNNQEIPTHALIDCEAMGIAFMDQDFACCQQIPLQEQKQRRLAEVMDRRPIESGHITHSAKVGLKIQDHEEQLPIFITKLGYYPIVQGIPWLRSHDIAVWFVSNSMTFGSQYCTTHCLDAPVPVQGVTEEPPEPVYSARDRFEPEIRPQRLFRRNIVRFNRSSLIQTVRKGRSTVPKTSLYDINKAIEAKNLKKRPLEEIVPKHYHDFLPLFCRL